MTQRKGGLYHFVAASIGFFLLLNLVILAVPTMVQDYTGVNTSQLQESTNLSSNVSANQTGTNQVVDQASSLVAVYTNFESQNPILLAITTLFLFVIAVVLIDLLWVG